MSDDFNGASTGEEARKKKKKVTLLGFLGQLGKQDIPDYKREKIPKKSVDQPLHARKVSSLLV